MVRIPDHAAVVLAAAAAARVRAASGRKLLGYVDPFIGVDGDGQTVPGAGLPFGFARVSPDTTDPGSKYSTTGYDSNGEILGFSQTHVSGTGGSSKYGNFRMTPLVGELKVGDIHFSKNEEEAAPGYYSVVLAQDRIKAELTATRLCGLHRYTFPPTSKAHVLVDATSVIEVDNRAMPTPVSFKQRPVRSEIRVVYPNHVEAARASRAGGIPSHKPCTSPQSSTDRLPPPALGSGRSVSKTVQLRAERMSV